MNRVRSKASRIVFWVVAVVICLLMLGPILWGISTSLKAPSKILEYPPVLIPREPTLMHYQTLIRTNIHKYIANSGIVSVLSVGLCLLIGSLAAYALARLNFHGHKLIMFGIITIMSIPLVSLMVPTYTFLARLGLIDTRISLVVLYTAYQLPMTIWVLKGFFDTIPSALEKAAMVDGYSRLESLRKIVFPLSLPGLVAAGLFVLVFAWNDFTIALIMTSTDRIRTLPVAVYFYMGFFGREWGPLMAAAIVSIIPIIIIFAVFQRYFLSGMTSGSLKG